MDEAYSKAAEGSEASLNLYLLGLVVFLILDS